MYFTGHYQNVHNYTSLPWSKYTHTPAESVSTRFEKSLILRTENTSLLWTHRSKTIQVLLNRRVEQRLYCVNKINDRLCFQSSSGIGHLSWAAAFYRRRITYTMQTKKACLSHDYKARTQTTNPQPWMVNTSTAAVRGRNLKGRSFQPFSFHHIWYDEKWHSEHPFNSTS